jgi:D-alanine-D-alanine ligase-like ATP-grasp enzyme
MPTPESPPSAPGLTAHPRQAFFGPNPYSAEPALVAALVLTPAAIAAGPARCARITELSKALFEAPPSFEACATPLGIGEFLARWTLAALNKTRGFLHVAKAIEEDGEILLVLGFHQGPLSYRALGLALHLFEHAESITPREYRARLREILRSCGKFHPDYQVTFLMQAAREAGVPFLSVLQPRKAWQFGWGVRSEVFVESQSGRDSAIGERISVDKPAAKLFLSGLGVPVPLHLLAESTDDLAKATKLLGWPCIVKPISAGRSRGVVTDIGDLDHLTRAVADTLANHGSPVMIERQIPGEVYRILVARGRVAAVVRRAAPYVVGDGVRTVRTLIEAHNRERAETGAKQSFVGDIPLDDECEAALVREGIGLDDVPKKGRKLSLRRIPLLSSGAVYTDVTAETHPDTCRMAVLIAASLGIENCGIDFLTADISRSMNEMGGVLEANTMPGLRVPMMAGIDPVAIGRIALGDHAARVPAALLVVPAERLEDIRAAAAFDEATGWAIGLAAGVGSLALSAAHVPAIAGRPMTIHDCATLVVRNPFVERIFLAATFEQIAAVGLPLDRFDTVVKLDCKPDAAWDRVLREAAGTYAKAKNLNEALRQCGVAAATKKPAVKKSAKAAPPRKRSSA